MVGIFITARLGSTRLSHKHLIKIEGKPMIKWLVDRFDFGFKNEILEQKIKIFITTSDKEENRLFETVFENSNVKIFYGSNSNIPLRHLQCAKAHNIDYILSVDGDDILCSIEASKIVIKKLLETGNLVKTIGLPLGMNVMGYSTLFLERSLDQNKIEKLETGWGKIFEEKDIITIEIENNLNFLLLDKKEKDIALLVHPYLEAYFKNGMISKQMKWFFKFKKWIPVRGMAANNLLEYTFVNSKNEEITL